MKGPDELDLGLAAGDADLVAAVVFSQNEFRAALVENSAERVKSGTCRAVVVNAGNANALVGKRGRDVAEAMAHDAARGLSCDEKRVLVASTGTVGRVLPVESIVRATPQPCAALRPDGLDDLVHATDRTEERALRLVRSGKKTHGRLLGVAKGKGLLGLDLATTLAFVVTAIEVGKAFLCKTTAQAAATTIIRASGDIEASTDDAIYARSSGKTKNKPIDGGESGAAFSAALTEVPRELARGVVRDARGTTHVVTFASARSLSTMKNCGIALEAAAVDIAVQAAELVLSGAGLVLEAGKRAHEVMRHGGYSVRIRVGKGKGVACHVGCDLSPDTVRAAAGSRL